MDVSDYLRVPRVVEPRLDEAGSHPGAAGNNDDPDSDTYFEAVSSLVSSWAASALAEAVPEALFNAAYVRGSIVFDRLAQASVLWGRAEELFAIEDTLRAFASEDEQCVTVSHMKRAIYRTLLYSDRKAGPAKLLLRLRRPDEQVLSPAQLPAIEALMERAAHRAEGLEPEIRETLGNWRSERNDKYLRTTFLRVAASVLPAELAALVTNQFQPLLEVQLDAGSLNPALPLTTDAVTRVGALLDLSEADARTLLYLFRFACVTSLLHKEKYFSDFAMKTVIVAAIDESVSAAAQARGIFDRAMQVGQTIQEGSSLAAVQEHFPHMGFTYRPYILLLPPALEHAYLALSARERMTLLTQYRMGEAYWPAPLRAASTTSDASFPCGSVLFTAKESGRQEGLQLVTSLGLSPETLRDSLQSAVRDTTGAESARLGATVNELLKNDAVGVSIGHWAGPAAALNGEAP